MNQSDLPIRKDHALEEERAQEHHCCDPRHFTKDRVDWNNRTVIIDSVGQSPKGRWYATKARHGRIKTHGDDLPNEPLPIDPRPVQDREPMEIGPINTPVYRYIVSFTE